ncbi:MAG: hypothetical protein JXR68_03695 [Bacteroidales bacterium]|nr:hypothetical protein [Bacteroidales bacterium]
MMEIKFLKNEQINFSKWNQAISESACPLTYSYSWYLDAVCENWGALASSDYSIIMPLPYYTKFNQLIIYTPPLIPKLGFFFNKIHDKTQIEFFFNSLPKNILSFELPLNKLNSFNREEQISKKTYHSIDLYNIYTKNYDEYSNLIKKRLAVKQKTYIISGLSINEIIAFLNKINYFKDTKKYNYLRRVLSITAIKNLSTVLAVFSEKNELIGLGIFILSSYSADLLAIAAINDEINTLSLIIDKFIKINSSKVLSLNFECNYSENAQKIFNEFGASKYYRLNIAYKRFPKIFRFLSSKKNK